MSAIQPAFRPQLLLSSTDGVVRDISETIISTSLNYTMDAGVELRVEIVDKAMAMLKAGYFRLGQTYEFRQYLNPLETFVGLGYGSESFTLVSLDVKQGNGDMANIALSFQDTDFSNLKRDFKPQAYRAANGFSFARNVAKKYKLKFVGEELKGKQETIKVKVRRNTESVWSILQKSASENQFLCFISNGTLYFASPKYLIGRWGIDVVNFTPDGEKKERAFRYIPLEYPTPNDETRYFLTELPQVRKSLDSPKIAEGSATIFGGSSRYLRAGMTVMLYGVNFQFDNAYLITSVDYQVDSSEPTQITFANISSLAPADKAKVDTKIAEVTVISGTGTS
jgi:hypothetical protein